MNMGNHIYDQPSSLPRETKRASWGCRTFA